ncbi:Flp pilus assembly protein TadD [Novosphingobium kunmingense]|uniref:Flp pilus assembly protein TadD n=1 Tax=Novosphingobium kunmingense TaxID=1211806 RepID=A0A2N0HKW6_9SPHN|nr:SPOR domain-containing protein [Novosphingobium kunmingense]PKB19580.1 Flp pilus assembly protein TadD [Novosphingobium kunmingense]
MAGAAPLAAQVGRPAIQSAPGSEGARLNAALGRLARNPRDVDALVEAGIASMAAGDGEAAIGFYQKADALSPNTVRIKAGLAGAYAVTGDAASAIPLFDAAEKLGLIDAARTADRGLAFDMVGDAVTAQRYYHEALMAGPNDETSRRLALSQAIAGDRRGMEVTLGPLLQRQDKAAWRTRAFALAILGQAAEAESIAKSTMPADMAAAMTNYLRYMTRLTPAQQASAANLGRFPRAAEIGRDDPQLAALVRTRPVAASATPSRATVAAAAAQRSDRRSRDRRREQPAPVTAAPPLATVAAAAPAPLPTGELPPLRPAQSPAPAVAVTQAPAIAPARVTNAPATSKPVAVAASAATTSSPYTFGPTPAQVTTPTPVAPPPTVAPAPASPRSEPGFATLDPAGSAFELNPSTPAVPAVAAAPPPAPAPVAAAPVPVAPRPAAPARPRSLAEVFADLTPPSREAEPKAGAVDLRKIKAAAPAKVVDPKTAKLADATCEPVKPAARGKAAPVPKGKAAATQCKLDPKAQAAKDAKDAKAREKASPSRYWVQVATGRDKKALAFDWRKLVKDEAVLKGRKAYTTQWGQANRLLTGPFESSAQANAFLAQVKKAGLSGAFMFNSPAGQDVDPLPGT